MKIGILTLTGESNYGNKLQNYAMQYVLMQYGLKVETIRVGKKSYIKVRMQNCFQRILYLFLSERRKKRTKRTAKFLSFNRNIIWAKGHIYIREKDKKIRRMLGDYDYLIYGSDQIWNPEFKSFSDLYLGKYAKKEKNIAVSASLGISRIPVEYKEMFQDGLFQFKRISVREESAKEELIKLNSTIHIETLVDPTMMLNADEWRKLEKEVRGITSCYYITYFLGNNTEFQRGMCDSRTDISGMDIGKGTNYGPGEFLYLVRNAEAVVTDSFHASVFALIFGKELCIIKRRDNYSSMNSRIETLLKKTGVEYKIDESCIFIPANALYTPFAAERLGAERDKFHQYLFESIWS